MRVATDHGAGRPHRSRRRSTVGAGGQRLRPANQEAQARKNRPERPLEDWAAAKRARSETPVCTSHPVLTISQKTICKPVNLYCTLILLLGARLQGPRLRFGGGYGVRSQLRIRFEGGSRQIGFIDTFLPQKLNFSRWLRRHKRVRPNNLLHTKNPVCKASVVSFWGLE